LLLLTGLLGFSGTVARADDQPRPTAQPRVKGKRPLRNPRRTHRMGK